MKTSLVRTLLILALFSFGCASNAQFEDEFEMDEKGEVDAPRVKVSSKDLKLLSEARKSRSERDMVAAASRILSLDPNHLDALNALGLHYFQKGQLGLAKIIFSRGSEAHPKSPTFHNNMGIIHLTEDKVGKAIDSFKKALGLSSSYRIASANLGSIYLEYMDYANALQPLETGYKAVRKDIDAKKSYAIEVANNYGVALAGSGQTSDALSVFRRILEKDERNPKVLLNYAIILVEKKKDFDEGRKTLNRIKFIADDPQLLKRADKLERRLNQFEKDAKK